MILTFPKFHLLEGPTLRPLVMRSSEEVAQLEEGTNLVLTKERPSNKGDVIIKITRGNVVNLPSREHDTKAVQGLEG